MKKPINFGKSLDLNREKGLEVEARKRIIL